MKTLIKRSQWLLVLALLSSPQVLADDEMDHVSDDLLGPSVCYCCNGNTPSRFDRDGADASAAACSQACKNNGFNGGFYYGGGNPKCRAFLSPEQDPSFLE